MALAGQQPPKVAAAASLRPPPAMFKQAMQKLMEAQNMNARDSAEAVRAYGLVHEASCVLRT